MLLSFCKFYWSSYGMPHVTLTKFLSQYSLNTKHYYILNFKIQSYFMCRQNWFSQAQWSSFTWYTFNTLPIMIVTQRKILGGYSITCHSMAWCGWSTLTFVKFICFCYKAGQNLACIYHATFINAKKTVKKMGQFSGTHVANYWANFLQIWYLAG